MRGRSEPHQAGEGGESIAVKVFTPGTGAPEAGLGVSDGPGSGDGSGGDRRISHRPPSHRQRPPSDPHPPAAPLRSPSFFSAGTWILPRPAAPFPGRVSPLFDPSPDTLRDGGKGRWCEQAGPGRLRHGAPRRPGPASGTGAIDPRAGRRPVRAASRDRSRSDGAAIPRGLPALRAGELAPAPGEFAGTPAVRPHPDPSRRNRIAEPGSTILPEAGKVPGARRARSGHPDPAAPRPRPCSGSRGGAPSFPGRPDRNLGEGRRVPERPRTSVEHGSERSDTLFPSEPTRASPEKDRRV